MVKAKKNRLLLSLLILVFAIAIAGTSTYAWFAVNRSVTAQNMQVTVKSDTTYLVIAKSATPIVSVDDLGTGTTVTATADDSVVLPVRYNSDANPAEGYTKWEIATGEGYDDGDALNATYHAVAEDDVDDYVIHYTFYVGLTSTTALPASNLMVTALTATAGTASSVFLPAVSVVLVCGSTTINFVDVNSNTVKNTNPGAILSSTVAKNTVYTIDAYVYVNGDNEYITSENATEANLGSFLLSMTLSCTPGA